MLQSIKANVTNSRYSSNISKYEIFYERTHTQKKNDYKKGKKREKQY